MEEIYLLLFSHEYLNSKYPNIKCKMELIDLDGSVDDYDVKYN
jgi:hypothetical protein